MKLSGWAFPSSGKAAVEITMDFKAELSLAAHHVIETAQPILYIELLT
jgi:hypothetical protein